MVDKFLWILSFNKGQAHCVVTLKGTDYRILLSILSDDMCTDRSNPTSLIESSKVKISNLLLMQTGLPLVCVEVVALRFWILFLLENLKVVLEIALGKWIMKYK